MEDIGNELTLSLPRNGSAGMLGPLMLIQSAVAPLEAVPLQQLQGYLPLTGGTLNGDLVFGGVGRRIKGDFSNITPFSNRLLFQTTVANSYTVVGAIPSGTGTTAAFGAYNNSDPDNTSSMSINCNATESSLIAGKTGTGAYLPMLFYTNNAVRMRIDIAGQVGIGVTPTARDNTILQISSGIGFPAVQVPSTDPNTLDDYRENTWMGTLTGTTGAPTTPVTAVGTYVKIGKLVLVTISFSNVNTTGASGFLQVNGLPFTVGGQNAWGGLTKAGLGATNDVMQFGAGTTTAYTVEISTTNRQNIVAGAGKYLFFSGCYLTA